MNPYYRSLLTQIQSLMDQESYKEALDLIDQELLVPYVDREVEEILKSYHDTCKAHIETSIPTFDINELMAYATGSQAQKIKAVSILKTLNLRQYNEVIQVLLDSDLEQEFKGELIESLMEQRIDDAFTIQKDGLKITFVASSIVNANEDPVLLQAKEYLDDWLGNDNPAFLNFCYRLLEQETLEMRPLDFEGIDPLSLAKSIVYLVMDAFGQTQEFATFEAIHGLLEVKMYPLGIERRGENNE